MDIKDVKQLLASPKRIVITAHRNPDGDALGASLALYHYLCQYGHAVTVAFPSEYPQIFDWMPDAHRSIIYDLDPVVVKDALTAADIIFALDYNALDRVDKMGEIIRPLKAIKIMIDHHREPELFADYMLSDITASSTAELIYAFIASLDDLKGVSKTVAECIFVGIITDTGSFKYATSPRLFRLVADLLELGVDDYHLQDLINNCLPEKKLRLLGHCLYNRMEVLPEYSTAIIWLSKKDYENFDIQRGDTEGIVNHALSMKQVRLACFVAEQPTIVKLSMRSKGDFNVQALCRDHFNGGGHKNASGGYSHANLRVTLQKLRDILPQYAADLNRADEPYA